MESLERLAHHLPGAIDRNLTPFVELEERRRGVPPGEHLLKRLEYLSDAEAQLMVHPRRERLDRVLKRNKGAAKQVEWLAELGRVVRIPPGDLHLVDLEATAALKAAFFFIATGLSKKFAT